MPGNGGRLLVRGGYPLEGRVRVSGAKNSALKLMAASLLAEGTSVLDNVPTITDVFLMAQVLRALGAKVDVGNGQAMIDPRPTVGYETPYEMVCKMRASISVLGPLLARFGKARVAMPGGCNIGSRKIDLHIDGLRALGAGVETKRGFIEARAAHLKGAVIQLELPSLGATENILMAATLAKGRTIVENAAREPELVELSDFLRQMGARIEGAGTDCLVIDGVKKLSGASHRIIPDRIEAGTFILAAGATGGYIFIEGARAQDLRIVIDKARHAGLAIKETPAGLLVKGPSRPLPVELATLPYPGFPTDLQPQMMSLLAKARGISVITENIFENRFHVGTQLAAMGAQVSVKGRHAVVRGMRELHGHQLTASDLRNAAALIIAGLSAEGETEIRGIAHLNRGYEGFADKLRGLGANIATSSAKRAMVLSQPTA